jgi:hypothetical protein
MFFKIKLGGIYIIEIGEYYYIGKSNDVFSRWSSHYTSLVMGKHSSPLLQEKFNELGVASLTFRVLEYISITDYKKVSNMKGKELEKNYNRLLLMKEKEWMKKWSVNFSLNKNNRYFS